MPASLPSLLLEDMCRRLYVEHQWAVDSIRRLEGGMNNRLYRVDVAAGPPLVLKRYRIDERCRLAREYSAFVFLHRQGVRCVPQPYVTVAPLGYAVYSFERGERRAAAQLTGEDVDAILFFILALQRFRPGYAGPRFLRAILPIGEGSLVQQTTYLRHRSATLERQLRDGALHPALDGADAAAILTWIAAALGAVERETPEPLRDYVTPREQWTLNPVDLGPHNMLFRPEGICYLDFEYFGWDDPLALMAALLTHDQMLDLPPTHRHSLRRGYCVARNLDSLENGRLDRLMLLHELNWMLTHLYELTPEMRSRRRFARADADEERYMAWQLERLNLRLQSLSRRLGLPVP